MDRRGFLVNIDLVVVFDCYFCLWHSYRRSYKRSAIYFLFNGSEAKVERVSTDPDTRGISNFLPNDHA